MMAHPRVYRHNVRCPECGSNWMPKAGTDQGRQVYRCGDCRRYYTPDAAYHRPSAADRERALAMYQEGSSLRAVGRVFGVSTQAVSRSKRGARLAARGRMRRQSRQRTAGVAGNRPAAVIACDEMRCGLIRRRDTANSGRSWVDFEIGDRSEATFDRLYSRLPAAELYRTDAYGVYGLLPADRHVVGKGGAVNWNEGFHSWCRGKLNRLGRRTKGYTKSVAMLEYSLASICGKWQQKPNSTLY